MYIAAAEGNHGSNGRGPQEECERQLFLGWDLVNPIRTKNLLFVCPCYIREIRLYVPSL